MRSATLILLLLLLAVLPAGAQDTVGRPYALASAPREATPVDSVYASPALRALVAEAADRNKVPAGLTSYHAQAETEIAAISRRADGAEGVVAVEQVATEVRWARDSRFEQRVLGYRSQQVGLSMSMLGVIGTGWVTPTLYGNRLLFQALTEEVAEDRSQRGRAPRRRRAARDTIILVHPLAEDRDSVYRYTGGDTALLLRVRGREIPIVRVHVEPRRRPAPRTGVFVGDVDLDATRRHVVRMRGKFAVIGRRPRWRDLAAAAGVQTVAFVEYVNGEFEGSFWLPSYQRLELQAALPTIGDARAVLRIVSRLRDHRVNDATLTFSSAARDSTADSTADSTRGRRRLLTWAPRDSVNRYRGWREELGEPTSRLSADDFDDVAPDAWRPTGRPRVEVRTPRSSDAFHFNRVEGAYTGVGLAVRMRDAAPGLMLRATAGRAWSERAVRGRLEGSWLRDGWLLGARAGRTLDLTNDFRSPFDSGSTIAALLLSLDDYDYVDRRAAALSLARLFGGREGRGRAASLRMEAGLGSDRSARAHVRRALFVGDSGFRENRGVDPGKYARVALAVEYHPDVNAEFVRPGAGAALLYERGDGELDWQRIEARLVGRRTWRRLTYAARVDAGVVLGDSPPPQQLFELGEGQSLPGYDYKEFAGDRAAVVRGMVMYTTPYLSSPVRLGRRLLLPAPSPALAAGVQAGWADASGAALASIARLGVRRDRATGAPVIDPATGGPAPLSRPTDGVRSSVNVGVRFFGGAVFVGGARPVDHATPWRLAVGFAQQL